MLQVGIAGLPNVGKSSLFNALTASSAPAENYPFCTVEPNVGIVEVPDERVGKIQELTPSEEGVPAQIQFVDIAGLVRGASRGEGLGNKFLGQIREVDAIAHVVRCFEDPDVAHVMGSVDPIRDWEIVDLELALADLDTLARRKEKVEKKAKSGEKDAIAEMAALERLVETLERGDSVREVSLNRSERTAIEGLNLLTMKPVLILANSGDDPAQGEAEAFQEALSRTGGAGGGCPPVVPVSLAIESELASLDREERREFLSELGFQEDVFARVIKAAYELLGLITFFSANEHQTTAWAIPNGTTAPEAAGVIHTDFQRGFIRAEAIGYPEYLELGSMKVARDRGAIRSEGKEYVVQDGDILFFRFNV